MKKRLFILGLLLAFLTVAVGIDAGPHFKKGGWWVEVEDETGITGWWPTYPGIIGVDGSAAFAAEGIDISGFASVGARITVRDSSDVEIYAYLAEADAALAVSNVYTDDCADDDTGDWTIDPSATLAFDTDHYEYANAVAGHGISCGKKTVTPGKLYRVSIDLKDGTASNISGQLSLRADDGTNLTGNVVLPATTGSYVTSTIFGVAIDTKLWIKLLTGDMAGSNIEIQNIKLDEVTALGAIGCHVVSTKDGSIQNWNGDTGTINWNDGSGYEFEIEEYYQRNKTHSIGK